jgi:hypothetical protein
LPGKRQRAKKRGVDLISDALPFGRLWYAKSHAVSNAINYAKFFSRSHDAVIRVYDEAGDVIQTGLYPTNSLKQTIAITLGTAIAAIFAIYIGLKPKALK